ncbi:MAG: NADH-quinone oxidoreductase subunit K [Anaerosomatales bacterium]|nr:NADH-quinone oxidoreductase subunit K [Anaerosomatales bacterium]
MIVVVLASAVFSVGLYVVLVRRDLVAILAGVELMLGAANVLLVALASVAGSFTALVESAGALVIVLAAAEAAVGLALVIAAVRRSGRSRTDEFTEVSG